VSDIFISYASEDRPRAAGIAEALRAEGWSVWWDRNIPAGKRFSDIIEEEIANARAMVVLWSNVSVTKDWVIEEAEDGKKRGILVPVFLEPVQPPRGFRRIGAADLSGWSGGRSDTAFRTLCQNIAPMIGATNAPRTVPVPQVRHVFRVVLACPSDVQPERNALAVAISIDLNQLLRDMELSAFVELSRWETDAYPGLHEQGPQSLVASGLPSEDCDILIGVVWKRLAIGTEHEIRKALAARKLRGTPQVMLYFGKNPYEPTSPSEISQLQRLQEFKANLEAIPIPAERPLIWEYKGDPTTFAGEVQKNLRKIIFEQLRKTADVGTPVLRYSFHAEPVLLRAEGITELISNCFLHCT
jgi:hypothetical protein